ncbi:MAG TPA: hypothetical protein VFX84_01720, partial [Candidatus Saccharimonadales bacterium]|nr:hypothetical protein [Candidatus Saccharimonadales bacterium]
LHDRLRRQTQPDWIDPAKATLTYDYFWSNDWAYEWKLDGERVLARKRGSPNGATRSTWTWRVIPTARPR